MTWHIVRLSRIGYLIHLLIGWLVDFGIVSVRTISGKVAKLLTSKTRSVIVCILIYRLWMSTFRLTFTRQGLYYDWSGYWVLHRS